MINRVQPIYPVLARQARIQGTVRLNTMIDKDGRVHRSEVSFGIQRC